MKILLVVYDNDMYIHYFPTGLGYIAAALARQGHEVSIYSQDLHHYPDAHLTEHLDQNRFDLVGVGVIGGYYQYRKLLKLSAAINRSKRRPFYVLGGHGPSPNPDFFLRKTTADAIVIGEGETTITELVSALAHHKPLAGIPGLAFRDGGKTVVNKKRPLIKDLNSIPFPAYDLFPMQYYRLFREPHTRPRDFVMPMISGRGCPFKCTFCYRMDEGFRPRSTESIIEEIRLLKARYRINYISFTDDLLMSSVGRAAALCEAFLKARLDIRWECNGRLNFARPALLRLMKKAGCVFINYGIEALDDDVLAKMKKCLTVAQIHQGTEETLRAGISPGLNVIFGNIGDTRETLRKGVEFLLKHDDGAQLRTIRPVTPYPGSPLYYHALKTGLLKDCADFYDHKHVNSDLLAVNFTDLSDQEFHAALFEANRTLIENYFRNKTKAAVAEARRLYFNRNVDFRGFRPT